MCSTGTKINAFFAIIFQLKLPAIILVLLEIKWNESGFRPPLCTYRLNWARRTSWGWWDDWDDTVLQTQDSKFEPWRSEAEHATSRSRRLPTILTFTRGWGRNNFVSFKPPRPGTEPRSVCSYFSSFEAGIANEISSFKWRKIFPCMKKLASPKKKCNWQSIYHELIYPFQWLFVWCKKWFNPQPFNRQILQSEFSPTWSCVSLTRSTTSSEWKLFIFHKMEVNCFQILLIDVTFYL